MTAPVLDPAPTDAPRRPLRLVARGSRARRRWLRLLGLLLAVAVLVGVVWAVWFSSLLAAQQVRVTGVTGARADAVLAAAALPVGQPLARIETQPAEDAVRALPWVATAEVRRGWPSELVVAVTTREPVAVLIDAAGATGGSVRRAVDAEGVVFDPEGALPKGLPRVTAAGDGLAEAMAVLASLPPDLARKVVSVEATTQDDVLLRLRSGDQVRWGSADQAAFKADVLRALLGSRKADLYDVSAPEMPSTWRSRG